MDKKKKVIIGVVALIGIILIVIAILLFTSGSKSYTITYDTNGGNLITSDIVKEGEKINKPTTPTKEGYTFVRWEYLNTEYDFTTPVTGDMTLKAIWEENKPEVKYVISFEVEGQTKQLEVSTLDRNAVDSLGFEEKDGYD